MLNPDTIEADAVARLKLGGHKSELSPQAIAVIQAICKSMNELVEKKPKPATVPKVDAAHEIKTTSAMRQLTNAFVAAWQVRFGGPYKFNGAADGKAADDLLKLGLTVEQILGVAKKAWNKPEEFNCKHAMTLRGLHSRFNEIRGEVGALNGAKKPTGWGQVCP